MACSIWMNGCDSRHVSIDYCTQDTAVNALVHLQAIRKERAFSEFAVEVRESSLFFFLLLIIAESKIAFL
jgi:hypothetical protein